MTLQVELIYDQDCPNVDQVRRTLREAFDLAGIPSGWIEWDRESPNSPVHTRGYGSPTVLVNGTDVMGQEPNEGQNCCRIYDTRDSGYQGVPPVEAVLKALEPQDSRRFGWSRIFVAIPGLGASLLPVGVCPGCWPAYAGVLSSLGLGSLLYAAYLLPVTVGFLLISLGLLAYRANSRRGYGPLVLGSLAAVGMLVGKFAVSSDVMFFGSASVFVGAALWNAWPTPKAKVSSCDTRVAQESGMRIHDDLSRGKGN